MRTLFGRKTNESFCEEAPCQPDLPPPQFNKDDEDTAPWISREHGAQRCGSAARWKGKSFHWVTAGKKNLQESITSLSSISCLPCVSFHHLYAPLKPDLHVPCE